MGNEKPACGGSGGGGDRQGGAPIEDAHAQQNDVSAPMGGIQPEHQRSAGPVRANPAAQVGAARRRTDHRWRTRYGWVGGLMGRSGDPGIPGVRQGGDANDPGSSERGPQRGTMGAPRQEGAQDPAGLGALKGGGFRAISGIGTGHRDAW